MVRTRGDASVTKVAGEKAPRKQLGGGSSSSSADTSSGDSARKKNTNFGLPYCQQPTPAWQKSVKSFFSFAPKPNQNPREEDDEDKENTNEQDIMEVEETAPKKMRKGKGKGLANGKSAPKKSAPKGKKKGSDTDKVNESMHTDEKGDSDSGMSEPAAEENKPTKLPKSRVIESDDDE